MGGLRLTLALGRAQLQHDYANSWSSEARKYYNTIPGRRAPAALRIASLLLSSWDDSKRDDKDREERAIVIILPPFIRACSVLLFIDQAYCSYSIVDLGYYI